MVHRVPPWRALELRLGSFETATLGGAEAALETPRLAAVVDRGAEPLELVGSGSAGGSP